MSMLTPEFSSGGRWYRIWRGMGEEFTTQGWHLSARRCTTDWRRAGLAVGQSDLCVPRHYGAKWSLVATGPVQVLTRGARLADLHLLPLELGEVLGSVLNIPFIGQVLEKLSS